MNWNNKTLQEKQQSGKIRSFKIEKRSSNGAKVPKLPVVSKELEWMRWNLPYFCNEYALEVVEEHLFDCEGKRKFRFDFAIPALKIGIEYEGLFSEKSGHTTARGFTKDTDKYNLCQQQGWKLLRYTALNYRNVLTDLKRLIDGGDNLHG